MHIPPGQVGGCNEAVHSTASHFCTRYMWKAFLCKHRREVPLAWQRHLHGRAGRASIVPATCQQACAMGSGHTLWHLGLIHVSLSSGRNAKVGAAYPPSQLKVLRHCIPSLSGQPCGTSQLRGTSQMYISGCCSYMPPLQHATTAAGGLALPTSRALGIRPPG